ncbi:hypothetical protein NDU88_002871 [Pleurodeles waltl]|uniref:Uncharacterized protein n=1 Tax=Pleurodeles waltl TaxID=8319 RepID=A0AAV7KTC7_PLEWA|nr:hypothetical protein NDU88_002871 [Pleurodeles waltl]
MAGRRTFKEPDLGFPEGSGDRERRRSGEERETRRTEEPRSSRTVCPNRGREEGEEPDGGCPDQGQKKNQSLGSGIH